MNIDQLLRQHAPDDALMRTETDRLRATVLDDAIADSGRSHMAVLPRVRRPRTLLRISAAAAALAVVATGLSLSLDGGSPASAAQRRFVNAAAAPAYETYGAFSSGSTVYIGNHQVTFDEKIKSLYYTSEGVLVRTGRVAETDASGASHYELIRPDGTHTGIDLSMGDRVVATDPNSPNVAYTEPAGNRWSFVVVNLVTGKQVARTTVDGAFTWGGWEAPPVTMSGERVWALFDAGWMEYDWKAGTSRLLPGTEGAILSAGHGRAFSPTGASENVSRDWTVQDLSSGGLLRDIRIGPESPSPDISPDGRFVRLQAGYTGFNEAGDMIDPPGPYEFVNIDSGMAVDLDRPGPLGWTPGGNTLEVDAKHDRLTVCSPSTGRCDRIDLPIKGAGRIKLGGNSYEA